MKSKHKMSTKTFGKRSIFSTTVITLKTVNSMIKRTRRSSADSKLKQNQSPSLKMYSYIKDNDKGGKSAKAIKKNIIKK